MRQEGKSQLTAIASLQVSYRITLPVARHPDVRVKRVRQKGVAACVVGCSAAIRQLSGEERTFLTDA
jgi:hypothetical protein